MIFISFLIALSTIFPLIYSSFLLNCLIFLIDSLRTKLNFIFLADKDRQLLLFYFFYPFFNDTSSFCFDLELKASPWFSLLYRVTYLLWHNFVRRSSCTLLILDLLWVWGSSFKPSSFLDAVYIIVNEFLLSFDGWVN